MTYPWQTDAGSARSRSGAGATATDTRANGWTTRLLLEGKAEGGDQLDAGEADPAFLQDVKTRSPDLRS